MRLKTISNLHFLKNKRVLLRVDLNVTLKSGKFEPSDVWKLKSILPTIKYLRRHGAKIILLSSRGRPHGFDHDWSLAPVVAKLSSMLGVSIPLWTYDFSQCERRAHALKAGEIVCLENLRFHHAEEENDAHFAKQLSRIGQLYVDDAFANIHRRHASMAAITRYLPSYAGFLVAYEVEHLHNILKTKRHPVVAVIGGNKISTKMSLIKKLLREVDAVLLGGALANNVLAAMDYKVGRSMVEGEMISWSKGILSNKLKVPVDAVVASSPSAKKSHISAIGSVKKNEMILDIGPDTVALYAAIIKKAKIIIWNGPLGYFEEKQFSKGTTDIVKALAGSRGHAYVGGGETVKAILQEGAEDSMYFISTGGGAMLSFLENKPMPALNALVKK